MKNIHMHSYNRILSADQREATFKFWEHPW